MPAYVIRYLSPGRGDILVEDPTLTIDLNDGWCRIHDRDGLALAVPAEHIAAVQRVDEPEERPAPREE